MKEYNYKGSLYWVEKDGTIISQKTGKTLKPRIDPDGYLTVTIGASKSRNYPSTRTSKRVHRMVAECFVENPNPKIYTEVNHKDFDRTNCNAENLEWVTHKENIEYSVKNNRWYLVENDCTGSNNFNAKLNEEKVKDIRKRYNNNEPIYRIAKLYGVGWTTVSHIVKNETWKNI